MRPTVIRTTGAEDRSFSRAGRAGGREAVRRDAPSSGAVARSATVGFVARTGADQSVGPAGGADRSTCVGAESVTGTAAKRTTGAATARVAAGIAGETFSANAVGDTPGSRLDAGATGRSCLLVSRAGSLTRPGSAGAPNASDTGGLSPTMLAERSCCAAGTGGATPSASSLPGFELGTGLLEGVVRPFASWVGWSSKRATGCSGSSRIDASIATVVSGANMGGITGRATSASPSVRSTSRVR